MNNNGKDRIIGIVILLLVAALSLLLVSYSKVRKQESYFWLSAADDSRLQQLTEKCTNGTITPKEFAEYKQLANRSLEKRNNLTRFIP